MPCYVRYQSFRVFSDAPIITFLRSWRVVLLCKGCRATGVVVHMTLLHTYRVGPSAVKANSRERATLAHFVVVRRVTGHSCSAGDGAPYDVLGFLILHRVRPQRLRECRSERAHSGSRRSTMSRCSRRPPTASRSSCSSDRGGPRVKVVHAGSGRRNLAAVTHRIAPVTTTHMTHRAANDVRDTSR